MKEKYCGKCDTVKSVEEFNKNTNKKDGLSSICKTCHSEYRKKYYRNNKKKEVSQVKKYQQKNPEKSGRIYEGICKLDGCNNISYLSKRDIKNNKKRYCSKECSYKGSRISEFQCHFDSIKKGAVKRKKEFDLDVKFLEELYLKQNGKCAITNVPIEVKHKNDITVLYNSASLDRIDSSKGYTEDNVQWVMLGINYMKLNFPEEDLHKALQLIVENYKQD